MLAGPAAALILVASGSLAEREDILPTGPTALNLVVPHCEETEARVSGQRSQQKLLWCDQAKAGRSQRLQWSSHVPYLPHGCAIKWHRPLGNLKQEREARSRLRGNTRAAKTGTVAGGRADGVPKRAGDGTPVIQAGRHMAHNAG